MWWMKSASMSSQAAFNFGSTGASATAREGPDEERRRPVGSIGRADTVFDIGSGIR
jgi:hypothetical protein